MSQDKAILDLVSEELRHQERMLPHFRYMHLKEGEIRNTSMMFRELAIKICETIKAGPERTVALRKLLEAKDAAVRAVVIPGC